MSMTFGCPWHGLVRNNQLEINATRRIDWVQLGAASEALRGVSRLIRHPNAPTLERTSSEAAADAAAGYQWRDYALLAGAGQLHGKSLGLRQWIYIDDNDECWSVSPSIAVTNSSGSITLRRFGVLGGAAQSHYYPLSGIELGQSTPTIPADGNYTPSTGTDLCDITPRGDKALFAVTVRWTRPQDERFDSVAMGFYEIVLSGAGGDLTVALNTLKTRAQALGTITATETRVPQVDYESPPIFDPVYGYAADPNRSRAMSVGFGVGDYVSDRLRRVKDRVLSMFYSATGELCTVTADYEAHSTLDAQVSVTWATNTFDITYALDEKFEGSVKLYLNGSLVDQDVIEASYTSALLRKDDPAGDPYHRSIPMHMTSSDQEWVGEQGSASFSKPLEPYTESGWRWRWVPAFNLAVDIGGAALIARDGFYVPIGFREVQGSNQERMLNIKVQAHCWKLLGLVRLLGQWGDFSNLELSTGTVCASPAGAITLPAITQVGATQRTYIYGSYQPATGEAVRDMVPLYYI